MKLTKTTIPATIRPRRKIGEFYAEVTQEELASDDLEITDHPVQQGANITDHAYKLPSVVTIRAVFGEDENTLEEIYRKLLDLQASRIPIDVVTGKRIYKNMLIKSLAQNTDRTTENVLSVSFDLKEVNMTQVEVTTVPPREQQREPGRTGATQNAGNKNPNEVTDESKRNSALVILSGGANG